jgi:hypothetical protein
VRITFERMADRRPVETLVERGDGVVFRMRGAGGGADLPRDLVHALVEQSLPVSDGIWGCVADGVVWGSMRHVSGRQPPHAAERSERLEKERAAAIRAAEHLADLVGRLARDDDVLPAETSRAGHDPQALAAAAAELASATAAWARLAPGETCTVEWRTTARPPRNGGRPRRDPRRPHRATVR